jgi:hypothetical protein
VTDLEARYDDTDRRIGKLVGRLEEDLPDAVVGDVRHRLRVRVEVSFSLTQQGRTRAAMAGAKVYLNASARAPRSSNLLPAWGFRPPPTPTGSARC